MRRPLEQSKSAGIKASATRQNAEKSGPPSSCGGQVLPASGRALPASGQALPVSGQAVGGPYMENAECELACVGDDPVGEGVP